MIRKKRGFQMGFSMIFSIFLIAIILAVAIYAIVAFLDIGTCANIGLFYGELDDRIEKAWSGGRTQDIFTSSLPSGIESVCFGNLTSYSSSGDREFEEEYDFLKKYFRQDKNVFLYPTEQACDNNLAFIKLEHAEPANFFCVKNIAGEVKIKLGKEISDNKVKICPVEMGKC
jgi:hypothetical protein